MFLKKKKSVFCFFFVKIITMYVAVCVMWKYVCRLVYLYEYLPHLHVSDE